MFGRLTEEEFAEKVLLYQEGMYRLAYSMLRNEAEAEDAVSESILRAFEHKDALKRTEKFKPWIMQILVNVSRTAITKRSKVMPMAEPEVFSTGVTQKPDEIWPIVLEMEEEFRTVVVLFYYEDFSVKEISSMLGIPEGTVKSRLSRGRDRLRKML